jgi:hypothetical protein
MAKKGNRKSKEGAAAAAAEADAKRRKFVRDAAGLGATPDIIGLLLEPKMPAEQVKADFTEELATGKALADLSVLSQWQAAIKLGSVSAIKWWTQSQMGMSERGPEKERPETNPISSPTTLPSSSVHEAAVLAFRRRS